MKLCYRDNLGIMIVAVDSSATPAVSFDGQYAYFTDTIGRDYKVSTCDIVAIDMEV